MVAAMDLADAGHEVEMFEVRPFVGGKVSSWLDKEGNHIEMGLHVFFGCYYNLFGIMERTGSFDKLRMKEHVHTFVNDGGHLGALDFRFPIGAPISGFSRHAAPKRVHTRCYCCKETLLCSHCRLKMCFVSHALSRRFQKPRLLGARVKSL